MQKERNVSVDLLKTIAIASVIFFHLWFSLTNNSLRHLGFFGISLFFIISGYLLAYKYPDLEKFSVKWMWKRYVRIAALYYLALIAIVIIFGNQVYSGSMWKNLITHFLFIDFYFQDTAYGIISVSWFLIPLMGMYFLFPYFNKLIKRRSYLLGAVMLAMVLFRIYQGGLTSFNLLFFLGEFCFGILCAHNKKNLYLLTCILTAITNTLMIIPFLVFYSVISFNLNFLSYKAEDSGRKKIKVKGNY
jgi:peptidoglycan/LPS O-acetylase OafA/YrhL